VLSDEKKSQARLIAEAAILEEMWKEEIEKEKVKVRLRISKWRWWHRFIPVVTITWRSK